MWEADFDPEVVVKQEGLEQINDQAVLSAVAEEVIQTSEKLVKDYRRGKENALEALMGSAMGRTGGKANPIILAEILKKKLAE